MNFRKGQSAIEYLTTYGWAILAIVVVGAVVMQYVGQRCPESAQGFTGQDLVLTEWALSSGNAQIIIRNQAGGNKVNITNVGINQGSNSSNTEIAYGNEKTLDLGINHGINSGECYSANITITYNFGEGDSKITGKTISGTINGKY